MHWDREFDIAFVKLRNTDYSHSQQPDGPGGDRDVLFDTNGDVMGVEFRYASDGVNLDGIPEQDLPDIQHLLQENGVVIKTPAPA
jgi:uncharacterized protein YuzE